MNSCKIYNTKQKTIILDMLQKNCNKHFTADEILDLLKLNNTPVGRATLYRFLDHLVASGDVIKYSIQDEKSACYQYKKEECLNHYHMKCSECGKLFHIDTNEISKMNKEIQKKYGFSIDSSRTVLYGLCRECKK